MARQSKQDKLNDKRIEQAYYATCTGITIPMMSIPKVFAEGRKALAEGCDDATLRERIRAYVETIRC